MRANFFCLVLLCLMAVHIDSNAQSNSDVATQFTEMYNASVFTQVPQGDSVLFYKHFTEHQIDAKIAYKMYSIFRVLYNDKFSKSQKQIILDYIVVNFSNAYNYFPIELAKQRFESLKQ